MDLDDLHDSIIDLLDNLKEHYPDDYKKSTEYTRFVDAAEFFLNWGNWEDKDE